MLIGSIDPALKNVGFAIIDTNTSKLIHLGKSNLLQPDCLKDGMSWKYSRSIIPKICKQYIEDRIDLFSKCDFIVIEMQMLSKFVQISLVLEALLLMICPTIILHPSSVKKHFNIGTGNYNKNKKRSVECCHRILASEDWEIVKLFPEKKRDDVCDAILQGRYAMHNIETLLNRYNSVPKTTSNLVTVKVKKRKKKSSSSVNKKKQKCI